MGSEMETGKAEGSRKTQFKAGHKGGPGRPSGGAPRPGGGPSAIQVMRRVANQDEAKDRTPLEKAFRQMLKSSPGQFAREMIRLEAGGSTQEVQHASPEGEPVADEGLERSAEACSRWLSEAAGRAKQGEAKS